MSRKITIKQINASSIPDGKIIKTSGDTFVFSDEVSGIVDGDKGDITISNSGATYTINQKAVSYDQIQDTLNTSILIGRYDAGGGPLQEIMIGTGLMLTGDTLVNTAAFYGSGGTGGEVNTASNLGTGIGLFAQKVGSDLRFKSLMAGPNIVISGNNTTIIISGSPSGEINNGINLGNNFNIFSGKSGNDLFFRTIRGVGSISISGNNTTIQISGGTLGEINTASNLGTGFEVFANKSGTDFRFRTLSGTPNQINIISDGSLLTLGLPQDIATTSSPTFRDVNAGNIVTTGGNQTILDIKTFASNIIANRLITASAFTSTVSTGTAPLTVASTTLVSNLNADLLDGIQGSDLVTRNTSQDIISDKRFVNSTLSFSAGRNSFVTGNGNTFIYATINSVELNYPFNTDIVSNLVLQARSSSAKDIVFVTGTEPSVRMNITGLGNVGIGVNSPTDLLHVNGNIRSSSGITGTRLISTVSTGTAPLTVSSTTLVNNLNADLIDNIQGNQLVTGATNIGTGVQIFSGKTNNQLNFRTVFGDPTIQISANTTTATVMYKPIIIVTGDSPTGIYPDGAIWIQI